MVNQIVQYPTFIASFDKQTSKISSCSTLSGWGFQVFVPASKLYTCTRPGLLYCPIAILAAFPDSAISVPNVGSRLSMVFPIGTNGAFGSLRLSSYTLTFYCLENWSIFPLKQIWFSQQGYHPKRYRESQHISSISDKGSYFIPNIIISSKVVNVCWSSEREAIYSCGWTSDDDLGSIIWNINKLTTKKVGTGRAVWWNVKTDYSVVSTMQ